MAKWTSVLFSDIRNKLGDQVVFSMWKGRPYMRSYVTPANPQTNDQQSYRLLLGDIVSWWQTNIKPTDAKVTAWNAEALSKLISGYNLYVQTGQGASLEAIELSVGAGISIEIDTIAIPSSDFTVMHEMTGPAYEFATTKRGAGTYVAADWTTAPVATDKFHMVNTKVGGVAGAEATASLDLSASKWKRNIASPYAPTELLAVA